MSDIGFCGSADSSTHVRAPCALNMPSIKNLCELCSTYSDGFRYLN